MSNPSLLQPKMTEAALALGKTLMSAEQYVRFQQAEQALKNDTAALGLLNKLSLSQTRMRKAQAGGNIMPEDLQALSDLQAQVQANPIIMDYTLSQRELTAFLQGVNAEISQLLGINFAVIARRSSCC